MILDEAVVVLVMILENVFTVLNEVVNDNLHIKYS